MKTFYTVRDIEDMHAAGTTEILTHDDVVLTDVAREKAIALGMRLTPAEDASPRSGTPSVRTGAVAPPPARPAAQSMTSPRPAAPPSPSDTAAKIKAAVVARLGTHKYDDLLDVIIPQVMAKLEQLKGGHLS